MKKFIIYGASALAGAAVGAIGTYIWLRPKKNENVIDDNYDETIDDVSDCFEEDYDEEDDDEADCDETIDDVSDDLEEDTDVERDESCYGPSTGFIDGVIDTFYQSMIEHHIDDNVASSVCKTIEYIEQYFPMHYIENIERKMLDMIEYGGYDNEQIHEFQEYIDKYVPKNDSEEIVQTEENAGTSEEVTEVVSTDNTVQ